MYNPRRHGGGFVYFFIRKDHLQRLFELKCPGYRFYNILQITQLLPYASCIRI